jgi:hypothetical protein
MGKFIPFFLIALICTCCNDNAPRQCILIKAALSYSAGGVTEKTEFVHDGTNYVEARKYYANSDGTFNDAPNSIRKFIYEDGKLKEDITTDQRYIHRYEFSYVDGEITEMNVHETETNDGTVVNDKIYTYHFIRNPENKAYLTKNIIGEDILEVYENGNLIKVGFKSSDGSYEAYGATWHFPYVYNYDDKPNAIKDNAALQLYIYSPNWGHCKNNMIEEIGNADTSPWSRKQTYQLDGALLKKWIYESTGLTVSFDYACK